MHDLNSNSSALSFPFPYHPTHPHLTSNSTFSHPDEFISTALSLCVNVNWDAWENSSRFKFKHSNLTPKQPNNSSNAPAAVVDDSLTSLTQTSFNYSKLSTVRIPARTSLTLQSFFSPVNSIVGSGVIGIPYALVRAGFGFGLILLIFVAAITDYSLRLMVRASTCLKSHWMALIWRHTIFFFFSPR